MSFEISLETSSDGDAVDDLVSSAFGPGREKRTVYQFRDGVDRLHSLCLAARGKDGDLLGSLRFWPVLLPDGEVEALFGPLAVNPDLRGLGIGKSLTARGIAEARTAGFGAVLIIGDPAYYHPFGFSEEAVSGLTLPGPTAPLTFMGMELKLGRLKGLHGPVMPAKSAVQPRRSLSA
ncbi:MAG: N-acetyltransferase [Alphaproteobacteria bacterium]